jgi:rhomboid protease GluP
MAMQTNALPEHTEVLPLGRIQSGRYFAIAVHAAGMLGWQLVSAAEQEAVFRTQRGGFGSLGEEVVIKLADDAVLFSSRSINEYYWREEQNKTNADLFRQAMDKAIGKSRTAEKRSQLDLRKQFTALVPSAAYMVTPILIYLNAAVFLCMIIAGISPISPTAQSLFAWGGNFRPLAVNGEWWRLFTYMFLHGGIVHLAMNMFALLYIGAFLEPLMGRLRFAAAYILTGICAGLLSICIHSFSVGVGASGAIFGMYGVFLAVLTTSHIQKAERTTLLRSILFFVVFNLIYGLQGNTDNAAHIGGLLSGFIIGYALYPGIKHAHPFKRQVQVVSVVVAVVLLVVAAALHFLAGIPLPTR